MRAWQLRSFDPGDFGLVGIADPAPGRDDVIIEDEAIGLNGSELQPIYGKWDGKNVQRSLPLTPGIDAAGTIVAVGAAVDIARHRPSRSMSPTA